MSGSCVHGWIGLVAHLLMSQKWRLKWAPLVLVLLPSLLHSVQQKMHWLDAITMNTLIIFGYVRHKADEHVSASAHAYITHPVPKDPLHKSGRVVQLVMVNNCKRAMKFPTGFAGYWQGGLPTVASTPKRKVRERVAGVTWAAFRFKSEVNWMVCSFVVFLSTFRSKHSPQTSNYCSTTMAFFVSVATRGSLTGKQKPSIFPLFGHVIQIGTNS